MFCKNLTKLRKERKLTQKELADKLKVSDKTVNHWEKNYSGPDIQSIMEIKKILDVTYDELFEE